MLDIDSSLGNRFVEIDSEGLPTFMEAMKRFLESKIV